MGRLPMSFVATRWTVHRSAGSRSWQSDGFLKGVRSSNPMLAAVFGKGTPGHDLHLILRKLRNTIHGGGLTWDHALIENGDLEHKLSVPLEEIAGLTEAAVRRTDGNPARWYVRVSATPHRSTGICL